MMNSIDDVLYFDDRSVQKVLRELDPEDLAKALHGADDALKEKFLGNMSDSYRHFARLEIEDTKASSLAEVEEARQKILDVMNLLFKEGELFGRLEDKQMDTLLRHVDSVSTLSFDTIPVLRFVTNDGKNRIFAIIKCLCGRFRLAKKEGVLALEENEKEFAQGFDRRDSAFVRDAFRMVIDFHSTPSFLAAYLKNSVASYGGSHLTRLCHQIIAAGAYYCMFGHWDYLQYAMMLSSFLSEPLRTEFYNRYSRHTFFDNSDPLL